MRFLILFVFVFGANAAPIKYRAQGGSVEALTVGKPSFIKIRGTGAPAKGDLAIDGKKATGSFEFEVTTLDTGIALRNEHMHDKYLESKTHPTAKLDVKEVELKNNFDANRPNMESTPFKGDLTFHGVTRPITGQFKVGDKRDVNAEFKIKLSDFKVEIPKYMGITVADEVNVEVKIAELKEVK